MKIYKLLLTLLILFALITFSYSSIECAQQTIKIETSYLLSRSPIPIAAAGTTFDLPFRPIVGSRVTRYILEVPTYVNTVTTTLSIIDSNSVVIFSGAAHNMTSNYSVPIDVELIGNYTLRLTLSGVAGGTATVYLTLVGY